jgi:hypothetical protein
MNQMTHNCELFNIFPTPIVKFKVPDELMVHIPSLKKRLDESPEKSGGHVITENKYILDTLEYQDLRSWILARVQEFTNTVLTINQTSLLTQSWINKYSFGESGNTRSYSNSITSGVLFMDTVDENDRLVFHKPEFGGVGVTVLEPKYFTDDTHDYTYVSRVYKMPVGTGQLVLFPSWTIHSIPINNTNRDIWSLSFNSMVGGSMGDSHRLNEFIYPKISSFASEQPNLGNGR